MSGRGPIRRTAVAVCVGGGVLVVLGVVLGIWRLTVPGDRAAAGTPVEAVVVGLGRWGLGHFGGPTTTVEYRAGGVSHRVVLGSFSFREPGHGRGTGITVYVDPADPSSVVSEDGMVTDYPMELVPPTFAAVGLVAIGIAGPRLRGRRTGQVLVSKPIPGGAPGLVVEFDHALPGYRTTVVDGLVARAERALIGGDAAARGAALQQLRAAVLPVARRGYHRDQVDRYIAQATKELIGVVERP